MGRRSEGESRRIARHVHARPVSLAKMTSSVFIPGLQGPPTVPEDALLFLARGVELAIAGAPAASRPPRVAEVRGLAQHLHFLGDLDGHPVYVAAAEEGATLPPALAWVPARSLFGALSDAAFGAASRAIAIAEWDVTHQFCGRCGVPTELSQTERARRCPKCELVFYPRIAPAVICLVEREGEALLARGTNFAPGRYSTLAGFVEAGESLEQTVHREVLEEVGVTLGDLRYFGSQPWPFGRSLMVGFTARYAGGDICCDPKEIADARWFRPDALPDLPAKLSIAHALITDWVERSKR